MTKRIWNLGILIALFLSGALQAQSAFERGIQSPTAASLGEYGNEQISMYTGKVSKSIPLTTITANGYTLNVGLSYSYSGFKPELIPGSMGLGWALNAGGVITRTVQSIRDEEPGSGYSDSNVYTKYQTVETNVNLFDAVSIGDLDAKPDIFYFNFNGISGKFYYDKYGNFQVDSNRKLIIEWDVTPSNRETGNRFTITDADGTKYYFGQSLRSEITETKTATIGDGGGPATYSDPYISAWYLTSIETINGEFISLDYIEEIDNTSNTTATYIDRKIYTEEIKSSQGINVYSQVQNSDIMRRSVWVKEITYKTQKVTINYAQGVNIRTDFSDEKHIESIVVSRGTHSTTYDFGYDYLGTTGGNSRLILKDVQITGTNNEQIPGWKFTYEGESLTDPLPLITTKEIDFWGYYNGETTNSNAQYLGLPEHYYYDEGTFVISHIEGMNLNPNPSKSKIGFLKQVTYPTGGTASYTYEPNEYSFISNHITQLYDFIEEPAYSASVTFSQSVSPPYLSTSTFEVDTEQGQDLAVIVNTSGFTENGTIPPNCQPPAPGGGLGIVYYGEAKFKNTSGGADETLLIGPQDNCVVYLSSGIYKVEFDLYDDAATDVTNGLYEVQMNVFVTPFLRREEADTKIGPGHRIQKITVNDGMNQGNSLVKTYAYNDKTDPTKSSGVLVSEVSTQFLETYDVKDSNGNILHSDIVRYRNSGSVMPLGTTQGEALGYSKVEETIQSSDGNSKKVYEFKSPRDFPDSYNPNVLNQFANAKSAIELFQPTSHDYGRGTPISETWYNSSGVIVRKKTFDYAHANKDGNSVGIDKYSPRYEMRRLGSVQGVTFKPFTIEYNMPVWSRLFNETDVIYEGGVEGPTSFKWYTHNAINQQPSKVLEGASNVDAKVTNYTYAYEIYTGTGGMQEKNMLTQLYSIELANDGETTVLSKNWTEWTNDLPTPNSSPWRAWKQWNWDGSVSPPSISNAVKNAEVLEYDVYGNPLEIMDVNGAKTKFYFGSNSSPFSQVGTGTDLTGIQRVIDTEDVITGGLRPGSGDDLFTDATYNSQGLVTSITGPDLVRVEYIYDNFNRLAATKNNAGDIVSENTYTYTDNLFSSTNPNWIESKSYSSSGNTRISRQYLDGLGRGIQSVSLSGSSTLISAMEYNDRGLTNKGWKPYLRMGITLDFEDTYSTDAESYYGPGSVPYTTTSYEASPLNRLVTSTPFGGSTNGVITQNYGISTIDTKDYSYTDTIDPEGLKQRTITDGWGRTVFTIADPDGLNLKTGFIYNELDQLLETRSPNYYNPPMGSVSANWVTIYTYDIFGNVLTKTGSDFGTIKYAYDKANQLRFSQNANQVVTNKVAFISYDKLGRAVKSGIADYQGAFSALDPDATASFETTEDYIKGVTAFDEAPNMATYPWSEFSTEMTGFNPQKAEGKVVADMYRFGLDPLEANVDTTGLGISGSETYQAIDTLSIGVSDALSGSNVLLKAGRAVVLKNGFTAFNGATLNAQIDPSLAGSDSVGVNSQTGANQWQLNLYSYDSEGRLAEKKTFTGSKRDWDATITYTYNWLGELTVRKVEFRGETLYHHYTYNTLGELTSVTLTLDGVVDTEIPEIEYTYDPDGQVEKKEYQGNTIMDYTYDIQSRLTKINDPAVNTHAFSADYSYFKNGNIEVAEFNNPLAGLGSAHQRYKYTHSYDAVSRLLSATYSNYNTGAWATTNAFKVNNLTYDRNGNITALRRYDDTVASIDDLGYTYSTSNRLNSIADASSETAGINWDAEDASFTYDSNGNMLSQSGKFTSMVYNEFNLPLQINTSSGDNLKANYNGIGQRIIKEFSGGSWTYYLRDGSETLATLNQDNELNFNITGMGLEGQLLEGIDDDVIDVSSTINSESESNDTQVTADGPIGTNTIDGTISASPYDTDWFYFNVLHEGTISISANTEGYSGPIVTLDWEIIKGSTSIASGNGSASFSVTPGTYHLKLDPVQGLSLDYYDLKLTVTSFDEYATRYFLKDHLGSTRAIVDDTGNHLASYDYYPFGLEMPGRSASSASPVDNYKFTGHERDDEATLNLDFMGARMYNPAIARMMQVDPMFARAPGWTSYRYGFNNPIRYIDPDGQYEVDGHYWSVYLAALISGRSDARALAYYSELPDHVMTNDGDIYYATNTWKHIPTQRRVHSLTGRNAISERHNSRYSFLTAKNARTRGEMLHRLGDGYAHTMLNGSGNVYPDGLGHGYRGHAPDKIANRPSLYLQYVKDLISTLGGSNADLFTFEYIADSGGSTEQNNAVFETEVRFREGTNSFYVEGDQGSTIEDYTNARNAHYGTNYKVTTVEVIRYTRNSDGEWEESRGTRTYVTSQ